MRIAQGIAATFLSDACLRDFNLSFKFRRAKPHLQPNLASVEEIATDIFTKVRNHAYSEILPDTPIKIPPRDVRNGSGLSLWRNSL